MERRGTGGREKVEKNEVQERKKKKKVPNVPSSSVRQKCGSETTPSPPCVKAKVRIE